MSPFSGNAFSEALQSCKSHCGWPERVSTHLASNEEASLLPVHSSKCLGLCMYTTLRGEGAGIRLGGGRQEKQVAEAKEHRERRESEPARTRIKGKVKIYQEGVSEVLRGSIHIFLF